ncbi:MAG: response regulator [Burkholderiales bacterium]|nr:response regulator [Burkholderiales bacterium]MDE2078561.1 response regulator [Burkholderiales bacterium]MDE2434424.1 response regulator [Burkholderiales bacterium]
MPKILVVEDQAEIRHLIRVTLACGQFEVNEAADGGSALQQAQSLKPDLVLLDVMMPGDLSGFDVCRQIKANPAMDGVKVMMLTALGEVSDVDQARDCGADAYWVKPFSPAELLDQIEALLP